MTTATRFVATPDDDTLLIPANPARLGFHIENQSDAALRIRLGPNPVSATEFDTVIAPHGIFVGEPFDVGGAPPLVYYTGQVRGRWASEPTPGDMVQVTELRGEV